MQKKQTPPYVSKFRRNLKNKSELAATKFKRFIVKANSIIGIISDWLIFSGVILFLVGRLVNLNLSEYDLILNDIRSQLPQSTKILHINPFDIHGFGYNTIVVVAKTNLPDIIVGKNEHLVFFFDKVDNEMLKKIYDPFNLTSSYKKKYVFELENMYEPLYSAYPYIIDVIDITNDNSKEIIIGFALPGSGYPIYIAAFSYDIERNQYTVIGTYPQYSADTKEYERIKPSDDEKDLFYNVQNEEEQFYLNASSGRDCFFFATTQGSSFTNDKVLVYCYRIWDLETESNAAPHYYHISIFLPEYSSINKNLQWRTLGTFKTNKKFSNLNIAGAIEEIENNLGFSVIPTDTYRNLPR